jgi:hypothetical protein
VTTPRYKVVAPQIVVEVSDARREVYLPRGARLPDTATEASIARLVDRELVVAEAATPPRATRSRKTAAPEPQEGTGDAGSDE